MGNYNEALVNELKAAEILEKKSALSLEDKDCLANNYNNIGEAYLKLGNHNKSLEYCTRALDLAKENDDKENMQEVCKTLSSVYAAMGNFQKAYEYHQLFKSIADTLLNSENTRATTEMQTKYETEKKEKEIELQQLKIQNQDSELNKKQITIYASAGGIFLLLLLAVFIFRSYRQKQKANVLLAEKNILIEQQKTIVEEKNKDITDSIHYAQRIQRAILPPASMVRKALPQSFIFFHPKDIVSGDFYWMHKHNGMVFIAACDCTGHGVPGAFMSMIGKDQLNNIVAEKNIIVPSEILTQLNKGIKNALQHESDEGEKVQDGMEISLCRIDLANNHIEYAGANRQLVMISDSQIHEFPPDKCPIGGYTEANYLYSNKQLSVKKNDMIYLFSDGYGDQFGGAKDKKFTSRKFKNLLLSISNYSADEQMKILRKTFEDWKGKHEQVDDVLVIGIKI